MGRKQERGRGCGDVMEGEEEIVQFLLVRIYPYRCQTIKRHCCLPQ